MCDNQRYQVLCNKSEAIYTSCYCEENVWKLLEYATKNKEDVEVDDLYAVFISNNNKTIPIWYQNKSEDNETPVIWDYHVVAVHKSTDLQTSYVYDLDTKLDFPESFRRYYQMALRVLPNIKKTYHREYRVVPAAYFLENFSSDRSHMLDPGTGKYMAEPPSYPCIECKNSRNNINTYISMSKDTGFEQHGQVMNEKEFELFFNFSDE